MTAPRRVGLFFGGRSVEHEVSVVSARGVAAALGEAGFECVPVGVTGAGRWLTPERSREILGGGDARVEAANNDDGARTAVDPGAGLIRLDPGGGSHALEVDVVFPLVHGWGGEDGRLQGALELAGMPYVGSGVTGSAVAMDKIASKKIFAAHDLPQTRWCAVRRDEYAESSTRVHERVASELGLPLFVKPSNGGSSVGVSRVANEAELADAFAAAFACDHHVVAEEAVDAREIECAVLGNDRPLASGLGEIVPSREFYDYAAKYLDGTSKLEVPAALEAEIAQIVRNHAVSAFQALGLAGFARIDFLLARNGLDVYLNEANTLPGFTPISMFPKLWQAEGLSFAELVARLVELAGERWRADRELRTRWQSENG